MATKSKMPLAAGRYRIERLLGVGGMGEVYLGRADDGALAALKRLPPAAADDPVRRERFLREAEAAHRLDHPAIVKVYDHFTSDEGEVWIAMEFAEGVTLHEMIVREGAVAPARVSEITRQITAGLAAAHDEGIVHRDLKAENVIVGPEDRVKILDFGLAKHLLREWTGTLTTDGAMIGTCRAMSPEQALGEKVDPRSDLFSLGVLMYEALTAVSPFAASTPLQTVSFLVGSPHQPVAERNPRVPPAMAELVERLLCKDREERPRSAREVMEILDGMELPPAGWRAAVAWVRGRLGK